MICVLINHNLVIVNEDYGCAELENNIRKKEIYILRERISLRTKCWKSHFCDGMLHAKKYYSVCRYWPRFIVMKGESMLLGNYTFTRCHFFFSISCSLVCPQYAFRNCNRAISCSNESIVLWINCWKSRN